MVLDGYGRAVSQCFAIQPSAVADGVCESAVGPSATVSGSNGFGAALCSATEGVRISPPVNAVNSVQAFCRPDCLCNG